MSKENTEAEIKSKMADGLTRDQAVEVLNNQKAHDEALAAEDAAASKKKK